LFDSICAFKQHYRKPGIQNQLMS